jgi:outer membrane protein assembly factor BamB
MAKSKVRVVPVADSETILSRVVPSSTHLLWGDHRFTACVTPTFERRWLLPVGWPIGTGGRSAVGISLKLATHEVSGVRLDDGVPVFRLPAPLGANVWRDQIVTATTDATLVCFDAATGARVRSIQLPWQPWNTGHRSGDHQMVVPQTPEGARDPRLCAADLRTGAVIWERGLLDEVAPWVLEPPLTNNYLNWLASTQTSSESIWVFSHGGATFGARVSDGAIAWSAPYAIPYPDFLVRDGRLTFFTADHHHVALEVSSGAVIYDVNCWPEFQGASFPGVGAVFNNRIAFPHQSGHLGVFDLDDGLLLDVREEKEDLWTCAVVDSRLVIGTGSGRLLVYDESIWDA